MATPNLKETIENQLPSTNEPVVAENIQITSPQENTLYRHAILRIYGLDYNENQYCCYPTNEGCTIS